MREWFLKGLYMDRYLSVAMATKDQDDTVIESWIKAKFTRTQVTPSVGEDEPIGKSQ